MFGLCNPSVEYVPCLAIEFFSVLSFGQLPFLLSMTHLSWETTCGICEWKMNTSLPLLCSVRITGRMSSPPDVPARECWLRFWRLCGSGVWGVRHFLGGCGGG